MEKTKARWQSSTSFIFATSAAAVGLGNIWRFPYLVGQNGGGAFVLIYLSFVLLIGLPLMMSEMMIGRMSRHNPAKAMASIAQQSGHSPAWGIVGAMTILSAFLILSFYVVVIGWILDYFFRAITGQWHFVNHLNSLKRVVHLPSNHWRMLIEDTVVITATSAVIIGGIKRGLERVTLLMFPLLLILMITLLSYISHIHGFAHAIHFLFHPNFSKLTTTTVLIALGQAFFSLNIAMAITMMFSAYLPQNVSILHAAITIAISDTAFALLSGLIVFPIVFTFHLEPSGGPNLIFQTLPIAFEQLPFGRLIASLFFLLLFFAAFSSAIALMEPAVVWAMEYFNISRLSSVCVMGVTCWLLSLGTVFSFTPGPHWTLFGYTFYQLLDQLTSQCLLPLGGLLTAIFSGWITQKTIIKNELSRHSYKAVFLCWNVIMRFIAPLAIILMTAVHII